MKEKIKKFCFLFIALSISYSVSSQSIDKDSSLIRYYSNNRNFTEAKNVLQHSSLYSESSPQFELLETEIWIEEAEDKYKKGLYKSSFELFLKASTRWSTHPLVRERLSEMRNKVLKDEPNEFLKKKLNDSNKNVNQDNSSWVAITQDIASLRLSQQKLDEKYWNLLYLISIFLFSHLSLILFFLIKIIKKP
jgi:hypothetical protein